MAFKIKNCRKITDLAHDAGSINIWAYATTDAAATVLAAGYFNDLRFRLSVNGIMIIMAVAGGVGDMLIVKVTAVPATGDVTVAVNSEASGS